MSVLLYSEISDLTLDRVQANVSTDAPVSAAELLRHVNEAYADVYEASGGAYTKVAGSVLWTGGGVASLAAEWTFPGSSGVEEVREFIQVWASTDVASTGAAATDVPLDPVDYAELLALRNSSGLGTYAAPKVRAVVRRSQTADTDGNRYDLYWWPSVAGFYFPAHYVRQFDPFDGGASDKPDVGDVESRDIALLAAARIAPLIGRAELVPSIISDLSERTRSSLERKLSAQLSAAQDR